MSGTLGPSQCLQYSQLATNGSSVTLDQQNQSVWGDSWNNLLLSTSTEPHADHQFSGLGLHIQAGTAARSLRLCSGPNQFDYTRPSVTPAIAANTENGGLMFEPNLTLLPGGPTASDLSMADPFQVTSQMDRELLDFKSVPLTQADMQSFTGHEGAMLDQRFPLLSGTWLAFLSFTDYPDIVEGANFIPTEEYNRNNFDPFGGISHACSWQQPSEPNSFM